jgi:mannitol-1-/sugar-/sorbitol-6-phosphatase
LSVELRCAALLFDLDGVLVDSRDSVAAHWAAWSKRRSVPIERLRPLMHGRPSRDIVAVVAPELDADAEAAAIDGAQARDRDGVKPVPGAAEVLGSLPTGCWAVVTSGRRILAESRLASLPRPEVLICGEDVEHGKPAPDGYLAAARALGADAAECVVLEDALPGLEAAAAAGMRALAVTTTHDAPELGPALATIPDLSSLAVRVDGPALSVSVH